jgi:hypothetical protein
MAFSIDLLRRRDSFEQILRSLSSKIDIEDLENELSGIQSLADRITQGGWFKRHLPEGNQTEEISPTTIFILLVTFAWVYTFENTSTKPKLNLQLLVVLAKYIWPLYELFLLSDSGKTQRALSNEDVKNWLMDRRNYPLVIEELNVKIPQDVVGYATVEIRKDNATISRWLAAGITRLHKEMCTILDIEPEIRGLTQQTLSLSGEKPLDQTITADREVPNWEPTQEEMNKFLLVNNSPLHGYLVPDIMDSLNKLWQQQNSLPTLNQTAEFYIKEHLSNTNLDHDQRALAQELLSNIPAWCASKGRSVQPISREELETRWRSIYSENLSPLITELLDQELLVQDGHGLRIKNSLVFDYLLAHKHIEEQTPSFLPPMDEVLPSRWVYWLLQEYYDRNEPDHAGTVLWDIQGSLPGYCSGSWEQIAAILDILPDALLSEPHIWILAKIVVQRQPFIYPNGDRPFSPEYRLQRRLPDKPTKLIQEAYEYVSQYTDGLNQLFTSARDEGHKIYSAVWPIFWKTPIKRMLKKHALSLMRLVSPDTGLAFRIRSLMTEITLRNILLFELQMTLSDEAKLAIAEPLIAWGVKEAGKYIRDYSDAKKEYRFRSWMLKQAVRGWPGYADWV